MLEAWCGCFHLMLTINGLIVAHEGEPAVRKNILGSTRPQFTFWYLLYREKIFCNESHQETLKQPALTSAKHIFTDFIVACVVFIWKDFLCFNQCSSEGFSLKD